MGNHQTSNSQNLELHTRARGLEDLNQDILWLNGVFQNQFPLKNFVLKVFPNSIEEDYEKIQLSLYKVYGDGKIELFKELEYGDFYLLFEKVMKENLIHNQVEKKQVDEEECCICLEKNIEVNLECGHCFCESCISNWIKKDSSCPMCRESCQDSNWILANPISKDEIGQDILNFINVNIV